MSIWYIWHTYRRSSLNNKCVPYSLVTHYISWYTFDAFHFDLIYLMNYFIRNERNLILPRLSWNWYWLLDKENCKRINNKTVNFFLLLFWFCNIFFLFVFVSHYRLKYCLFYIIIFFLQRFPSIYILDLHLLINSIHLLLLLHLFR